MTDPQPLTGDELATIKARAEAASPSPWSFPGIDSVAGGTLYDATRRIADIVYEQPEDHDGRIVRHLLVPEADANGAHIAGMDPATTLRLVAEIERLQAQVDEARTFHSSDMLGHCQEDCCGEPFPCRTLAALDAP